jgi:hypothetical protein
MKVIKVRCILDNNDVKSMVWLTKSGGISFVKNRITDYGIEHCFVSVADFSNFVFFCEPDKSNVKSAIVSIQ